MVLARVIFQAKFGKANELVKAFKSMDQILTPEQLEALQPRVLTDISGPFDTVVLETTHESLAAVEEHRKSIFAQADGMEGESPVRDLIVSGRNEYWTIEN